LNFATPPAYLVPQTCARRRSFQAGVPSPLGGGLQRVAREVAQNKFADQLTYRQLVALVVLQDETSATALQMAYFQRDQGEVAPSDAVALEPDDLADKEHSDHVSSEPTRMRAAENESLAPGPQAAGHFSQDLKLTPIGLTMRRQMRLEAIPTDDHVRPLEELANPVHPI
jgi:hypothetical protein